MYVIAFIFFLTSFNIFFASADDAENQSLTSLNFEKYKFYLENNSTNFNEELKTIEKYSSQFEKDFLKSVVYKKKGNFNKQFDFLYTHLKSLPENFSFYEEIIFAAAASGNFDKVENFIKENTNSKNYYSLYLNALSNYANGNSKAALLNFEKVLTVLKSAEVYYKLSYSQRASGNYDKAFQTLASGKLLLAQTDFNIPKFTIAQGSLLYLSGKYKEAKKYYEQGLKEADASGNNIEKIKALVNLGIMLDDEGDVYAARDYFEKAIALAEKINSIESAAFAHSEAGVSFTLTNELADAQQHYKTSYDLYKKINDKTRLAFLSYNLGNLKVNFSDYSSALKYFNEGLKLGGDNKRAQVQNFLGIADVYQNLSNFTKALNFYNLAKKTAEEIKDVTLQANVQTGLGVLYFNLDKPQKALDLFKEAERLVQNYDLPFLKADVYHKLGITYSELNDFSSAQKYFNYSIKTAEETGDIKSKLISSTDLAFLHFLQNNLNDAVVSLKKLIAESEKYQLDNLIVLQKTLLGKIYKQRDDNINAIKVFKEAELLGSSSKNFDAQIEINFELAEIYKQLAKNDEAEKYYTNSIKLIDELSKSLSGNSGIQISYFANYKNIYDALTELYLSQKKYENAFLIVEQARSRNTMQNLTNIKLNSIQESDTLLEKLYEYEWMINSGIYEKDEINKIEDGLRVVKNLLISKNKKTEKYLNGAPDLSIAEVQKQLDNHENLISFYVSDNYAQYFLLTKNTFSSDRISIKRDDLLKLIYAISPYYNPAYDDSEIYFNQDLFSLNAEAAFKLYKTFFENAVNEIPREESIIFNLPAELQAIPLELLVTEYSNNYSAYNYGDKKFLIYDYNISYTPSFKIYLLQKERERNNFNSVLLMGDPDLQNSSDLYGLRRGLLDDRDVYTRLSTLYPLEFSREEINEIEAVTSNSTSFLASDATESNFKLNSENKKIIHISTHTFQHKNQPLIVFSNKNDSRNDGLLEAEEIIELNLNSDLVVLSSCRSGLGEIDKAEGIIGMQKAFYEAGAKSLIVSLWDVSDKYTAKFMVEFYKQLSEGKSKSEALRNAKINFIKNYSANPYYWSAFVLYGNTESVELEQKSYFVFYIFIFLTTGIILVILYKKFRNIKTDLNSQT